MLSATELSTTTVTTRAEPVRQRRGLLQVVTLALHRVRLQCVLLAHRHLLRYGLVFD